VAPGGRGVALVQTPTPPQRSQDESADVLAFAACGQDLLATIIGPYTASSLSSSPTRIFHAGATWYPHKSGEKCWTTRPFANDLWDTFTGTEDGQRGHFVVRCRVCALVGVTATYYLKHGKSSNAWRHYGNILASSVVDDVQRGRHAALLAWRARKSGRAAGGGSGHGGPLDGYLTASRTRSMTPAQARPHHVRFVLMLVMTLSPLALTENKYLLEFVRGLGVSDNPPAPAGVRNILFDLFSFVTDQLCAKCGASKGSTEMCRFSTW